MAGVETEMIALAVKQVNHGEFYQTATGYGHTRTRQAPVKIAERNGERYHHSTDQFCEHEHLRVPMGKSKVTHGDEEGAEKHIKHGEGGHRNARGEFIRVEDWDDNRHADDEKNILRVSYKNPEIKEIYKEFYEKPNSKIAEKLLHTTYEDKSYLLKGK